MKYDMTLVFGAVGSGKSTYLAYLAKKYSSRGINVYTNIPLFGLKNVFLIDVDDIGSYHCKNGVLLIDEGTLCYHSRDWSKMPSDALSFYCLHRHFRCKIYFFAQSPDSLDKRLRELCQKTLWVHPSLLKRHCCVVKIPRGLVFPDGSEKGSITFGYKKPSFLSYVLCRRLRYRRFFKFFDSYAEIVNKPTILKCDRTQRMF